MVWSYIQPGFISTRSSSNAASAEPEPETIGEDEANGEIRRKRCLIAKRETRLLHRQWSQLGLQPEPRQSAPCRPSTTYPEQPSPGLREATSWPVDWRCLSSAPIGRQRRGRAGGARKFFFQGSWFWEASKRETDTDREGDGDGGSGRASHHMVTGQYMPDRRSAIPSVAERRGAK
jgi:hypothetical protein